MLKRRKAPTREEALQAEKELKDRLATMHRPEVHHEADDLSEQHGMNAGIRPAGRRIIRKRIRDEEDD